MGLGSEDSKNRVIKSGENIFAIGLSFTSFLSSTGTQFTGGALRNISGRTDYMLRQAQHERKFFATVRLTVLSQSHYSSLRAILSSIRSSALSLENFASTLLKTRKEFWMPSRVGLIRRS
jgi:hypothetical protein